MSLRVSELQVLLGYAGRNKHGRKHELLTKALHLLKAGCSPAVQMKIKELYRRRFPIKMVSPVDLTLPGVHSASSLPAGLAQLGFDSHGSPSPLLPVSLLGPKHELSLSHLPSALHPVHPDVKLQRLPFYDVLDELIKPTSLSKSAVSTQRLESWRPRPCLCCWSTVSLSLIDGENFSCIMIISHFNIYLYNIKAVEAFVKMRKTHCVSHIFTCDKCRGPKWTWCLSLWWKPTACVGI